MVVEVAGGGDGSKEVVPTCPEYELIGNDHQINCMLNDNHASVNHKAIVESGRYNPGSSGLVLVSWPRKLVPHDVLKEDVSWPKEE